MKITETTQALYRIAVACLLLLITRNVFSAATLLLGHADYAMFLPASDFFADSLKSGLAQTSISHRLLIDPAVRDWPELFQHYLFDNDYLKPGWSIFHSPPLSLLMLMGVATLLLAMSPTAVIALSVSTYAAGTAAVAHAARRATGEPIGRIVFLVILLAYPSLFMLDRGNLHSGLTSLCVIFYTISACKGRWRRLSWLALAIAVNLRPNVAIFALLEMVRTPDRRIAIIGMVTAGALSVGLGLAAYVIAHAIEPAYTPSAFLAGLDLYRKNYIDGLHGLFWNASLANVGNAVNYVLQVEPLHDPNHTLAASAVGAIMIGGLAVLAWLSRLPGPWLAFGLASCCTLFTPVLGVYHLLIFAGPLLLLVSARPEASDANLLKRAVAWLMLLQLLGFLQWNGQAPLLLTLIALVALAFPVLVLHGCHRNAEAVPVAASLAALSPIGGEVTHGYATALILFSALTWLMWRCLVVRRDEAAITGR